MIPRIDINGSRPRVVIPVRESKIKETYGESIQRPSRRADTELVRVSLPFPLRISYAPTQVARSAIVHSAIAVPFVFSLRRILEYYGIERIKAGKLDYYGGCHEWRTKRGIPGEMSTHAWGLAVDYCPNFGPLGEPSTMPYPIVDAFTQHGFLWGGLWRGRKDGMHFTAIDEGR